MRLLAALIADERGVVDIHTQTTYGGLHGLIPRDRRGGLNFAAVLAEPTAPSNMQTYERTVMLLCGGFAD
ncbi:hypothetical protein [Bradyrhizobium liaoningense]